ncbi:MAG: peptidase S8 and S53 subtilisin kexin sedolisin [Ignavibacteria bacterium]|nr:MAG: peptidase S8 and S53 subtilisin kexin sedolisin [Ignavibacteria bacterium]KAF0161870.1 MAG: peptidase S8 and S53 subtilisin kexin sedolisin [Ignavibacteria bacterium]
MELQNGKISINFGQYAGGHGQQVLGVAGALTDNNSSSIASIGFNTSLMWFNKGYNDIQRARIANADIINTSWEYWWEDGDTDAQIYGALQEGRIVVAAAGNAKRYITEPERPYVTYPAAHNFGSVGQVIAVSATGKNSSGIEQFADTPISIPTFNYSPGSNPIDSANAFIDFAAPGLGIRVLHDSLESEYATANGTSLSSPFVAGVVALVKSIYPSLTPQTAYTILKNSVDKVDQSRHPDSYTDANGYGWNQYTGWGRVNAYKALKYTIEHYGGTFNQNVILPAGDTWNLQPGVTLSFASGCALIVNGTLNAVGNSSNPITFTKSGSSNWGGIQFNNGSGGSLQHCNISYATNGVYSYNSSPTIKYSTIENNSSRGLYCDYYSSPVLVGNNLRSNTNYGIRLNYYSSPNLTDNGYPGTNVIRSNGSGMLTSYYSNPNLNGYMTYGNSVFDNTGYEIEAYYGCTVSAQRVFWGSGGTVYATSGSTIDNSNPLPNNPNLGRKLVADNLSNPYSNAVNLKIAADDLTPALDKQKEKKYDEAIPLFLNVFKNNKDVLLGRYALIKIEECFTQGGKKNYLDYSKKEIKPLLKEGSEVYVVALELETHQMVNLGLYKEAIATLQTILKKYNLNEAIEKNTLFSLGVFHTIFLGDKANSDKYFEELKNKYPKDDLVNQIEIVRGLGLASRNTLQGGSESIPVEVTSQTVTAANQEVEVANYPNPFNPSTVINYKLQEASHITLKVYDVLGREVATLVDEYKQPGSYKATFDTRHAELSRSIPSGIYFYRISAGDYTAVRKMILLK